MGTYLNPGNEAFLECLNSVIYVDKTELIRYTNGFLNTNNKLVCISRPRRFGKTMALQMLAAYYSKGCDSRKLFEGLKLGDFENPQAKDDENPFEKGWDTKKKAELFEMGLNKYDTLFLDIQGIIGRILNDDSVQKELGDFYKELPQLSDSRKKNIRHPLLTALQRRIVQDIRQNKDYAAFIPENETSLGNAMYSVYTHTGNQFVLLIDEWDCIFRNYEEDHFLQDKYIDLLRDLFKNAELLPMYALVYMTGILPIKRYETQSALNNFSEYTMLDMTPLEAFAGFTEEEAAALYQKYGMDFQKAQEWYDGYQLGNFGHIYNPNSVVKSVTRRKFNNYWTSTGTYESIRQPIEMDFDGLKRNIITMLGGGRCKIDPDSFNNTMTHFENADDVMTLLIHLGYLGYDSTTSEVYIPNKEIRKEFVRAIRGDKWKLTYAAIARSEDLLQATLDGDVEKVAACVAKVHEDNTSILAYNDENSLSCVIQLAYFQAQDDYWMIRELPAGKGFADIAFIPRRGVAKPAMIIELKWKKDAQTAIDQIHKKNYSDRFKEYFGEVLLVGINYEKNDTGKTHSCRIEKVYK